MDENPSDHASTDSVIIIVDDENEVSVVSQPQFVVQISDDPRYETALRKHEQTISKDPKDLEVKDLRYLINARKAFSTKSWKNDMYMKLYPEEMEKQEKLLAEKCRQSLIRNYEVRGLVTGTLANYRTRKTYTTPAKSFFFVY